MDTVVGVARLLARPVAAWLGVTGATPDQRRAEVMSYVTSPAADVDELVLRHLARGATWLVLFGIAAAIGLATVSVIVATSGGIADAAFGSIVFVMFFLFFRAGVHLLKMSVAHYLPERRWDRNRATWRIAMLWQVPDIVVAGVAAALVAFAAV